MTRARDATRVAAAFVSVGSVVGGFRVEEPVDRGGMGIVYRATQVSLGRPVALKVVAPELAADAQFRERFLREAHIAASISHPHLLPVYDAGDADGVLFLAMQLVEGVSLAELLTKEGRLEGERAASLVAQVAGALERAHRAGLVHRDVKPANILIEGDGGEEHAYLCDFGLSRRVAGASALTRPEGFVGSPAYAAPEQIRGAPVDGRADVYALGCVLFECLAGRRPFAHDDDIALMWAHMHEPPPLPGEIDDSLAAFDDLVGRALEKEPERRPPLAEFERLPASSSRRVAGPPLMERPAIGTSGGLPAVTSSFVGRDRELGEIVHMARRDDVRLLTLTGPGGTGKTRLALQAAAEVHDEFPAGVFWVPLAPLRDPLLVPSAMTQALGVQEQPGREPLDVLCERLAGNRLLVLLDNAEHLLPDLARTVSQVHAVGGPTLLVTSRERLQVAGEHAYPVPELDEEDAVDLFLARAAAAGVELGRTDTVEELCARLDNLPLAVELAAARAKALAPRQILERLSQRLDLLKGGRDADPRQQTLRATIEWSYDLLAAEEQRLFRALSVFAGGCTLEAAEQVADADLDTLQALVEKSLVRFTNERYWMLETIREYAHAGAGDAVNLDELRVRHASWLAELVEGEPATVDIDNEALRRLEAEHDNLRVALEWAVSRGDVRTGLGLAVGGLAYFFWWACGHVREGQTWLERLLALGGERPPELSARALVAVSFFAQALGDSDSAVRRAEEAVEAWKEIGDDDWILRSLNSAGCAALSARGYEDALRYFDEAIDRARTRGLPRWLATLGTNKAEAASELGDRDGARALMADALGYARDGGSRVSLIATLCALGLLDAVEGRPEAISELQEGLAAARELGFSANASDYLGGLAVVAAERGATEIAVVLASASEAIEERRGDMDKNPLVMLARERAFAAGSEGLDPVAYEQARGRGASLETEEAIDLALKVE